MIRLLLGMVLGPRFTVLALLPAMTFVVLLAIGAGIARDQGVLPTALTAAVAIASLQIGYLAGIAEKYFLAAARSGKLRTAFQGGPQPASRKVQPSALEA